jgi:hypothetical protein
MRIELAGKPSEGMTTLAYEIARILKKRTGKKVQQLVQESATTKKVRALGVDYNFYAYIPGWVELVYEVDKVGADAVLICEESSCEGCNCSSDEVIRVIGKSEASERTRHEEKVAKAWAELKEKLDSIPVEQI